MRRMRRNQLGSIVFNRKSQTWRLFVYDVNGKRKTKTVGSRSQYPTKTAARQAAESLRNELLSPPEEKPAASQQNAAGEPTVSQLVDSYRKERMPTRFSTRRSYNVWLDRYILPRWGGESIAKAQPREVELWLASLTLAPKSKAEVRALLGRLWDFAMWSGSIPVGRNPMGLVKVRGASKRIRQPRSLTVAEFQQFSVRLAEPYRTIALLGVMLGLRISETLALRWSDIDWLLGRVRIGRGIVMQHVGDVKTRRSDSTLYADPVLLRVLQTWRSACSFSSPDDWVFASPYKIGRLPVSYPGVWREFKRAALAAGLGSIATHSLRHTYRSWLDAAGTPVTVQRELMRHASIKTTMDVYGNVVTNEAVTAARRVAEMAISTPETAHTDVSD